MILLSLCAAVVVAAVVPAAAAAAGLPAAAVPADALAVLLAVAPAALSFDRIVSRRQVASRLADHLGPMDRVRALAMPLVVDRIHRPPLVGHRPAVDYLMRTRPAAAAAVLAAADFAIVAGRINHRLGENPAPAPTGPGAAPCCPCTVRTARQYLKINETYLDNHSSGH